MVRSFTSYGLSSQNMCKHINYLGQFLKSRLKIKLEATAEKECFFRFNRIAPWWETTRDQGQESRCEARSKIEIELNILTTFTNGSPWMKGTFRAEIFHYQRLLAYLKLIYLLSEEIQMSNVSLYTTRRRLKLHSHINCTKVITQQVKMILNNLN